MLNPYKDKNRKASSRAWIQRQINDPYVKKAIQEGYRARSAYKLMEIDDKFHLLKSCHNIVDLGCAPGGWLQVLLHRCPKNSHIIGMDLLPIDALSGVKFIQSDFLSDEALQKLSELIGESKLDGVISDMAANTIGHSRTDAIRTTALAENAMEFAFQNLKIGGFFICKFFQGGANQQILNPLKARFEKIHHFKPNASRKESPELYGVALNFKGN